MKLCGPGDVARECRPGRYPIRAFPFHLSRATCRPGNVSPVTSRPGNPGFVPGDSGKCCSVCADFRFRTRATIQWLEFIVESAISWSIKLQNHLYKGRSCPRSRIMEHANHEISSSVGLRNVSVMEEVQKVLLFWIQKEYKEKVEGLMLSLLDSWKYGFFFAVKEVSLLDQGTQGKQSISQLEK
ncbi:hypothetical protein Tco_0921113, partial [Tanacetum coccineum]